MEQIESRLNDVSIISNDEQTIETKWGWPLKDLYRNALSFYKGIFFLWQNNLVENEIRRKEINYGEFSLIYLSIEKAGKAVQFPYEDNLKLVAFSQQALHGSISTADLPPLGAFDVIGRDRRVAWQNLGNITKSQAMEGFIDLLDRSCVAFKPYVEAIKKDREEKARLAEEQERRRIEQIELERQQEINRKLLDEQKNREEQQKRKLQDALNQQTYLQFRAYAEKQYPGNPEQQAVLIRQLQNEHYHQYMQQLQAQISNVGIDKANTQEPNDTEAVANCTSNVVVTTNANLTPKENIQCDEKEECESDNDSDGFPIIPPAQMWTKPDIEQFKAEVAAGKGEGIIKVSSFRVNNLEMTWFYSN